MVVVAVHKGQKTYVMQILEELHRSWFYAETPVVLGEINGVMIEMKHGLTVADLHEYYVKHSAVVKYKLQYMLNGCKLEQTRFHDRQHMKQETYRLISGEVKYLLVCEGDELDEVRLILNAQGVKYKETTSEWLAVEVNLA